MKKILYMIGAVLLFSSAWADNPNSHITMVTYFPTPYMVYQDIKVKGPCEVGIMNNCSLQAKKDLLMNYVQVKNGYNMTLKGKDVNSSSSPVTTLKSGNGGNTSTRGTLQFGHNLTVNNMSTVRSIESSALALNALYLGGKEFPACNDYTDSSNHDVKWQNLNVDGGKSGVYLVCGNGKKISGGETTEPEPDPDPSTCPTDKPTEHQNREIAHGYCPQTRTVECNAGTSWEWITGSWEDTGICNCETGYIYDPDTKTCGLEGCVSPQVSAVCCKEAGGTWNTITKKCDIADNEQDDYHLEYKGEIWRTNDGGDFPLDFKASMHTYYILNETYVGGYVAVGVSPINIVPWACHNYATGATPYPVPHANLECSCKPDQYYYLGWVTEFTSVGSPLSKRSAAVFNKYKCISKNGRETGKPTL